LKAVSLDLKAVSLDFGNDLYRGQRRVDGQAALVGVQWFEILELGGDQ